MATVRVRRAGATKGAGKGRPPPPMSRLALMKLQGAKALRPPRPDPNQPRRWATWLAGCVMAAGGAIAGASWIGGNLVDARESVARAADGAAEAAGFKVRAIEVAGVAGARAQEVEAIAMPDARASLWGADPHVVKSRVEALDWVASADVARLWPGTLRIEVRKRTAIAVWREDAEIRVVDATGAVTPNANPADYAYLPMIVGPGAGPAAPPILEALENAPDLRARLDRLVRVNARRWDMKLKPDMTVQLPETNEGAALRRLEALHAEWRILDRPLARVDLRHGAHVLMTPADALAGGPGAPTPRASLRGA